MYLQYMYTHILQLNGFDLSKNNDELLPLKTFQMNTIFILCCSYRFFAGLTQAVLVRMCFRAPFTDWKRAR